MNLPLRTSPPLLAACLLLSAPALAGDYAWPVTRVLDGDTIEVDASADMPAELAKLKVRFLGVDTPEKGHRADCQREREAGQRATEFTTNRLAQAETIAFRDPRWGKWGGRVVAEVIADGQSLSQLLIQHGHGKPYDGKGKRPDWCAD